MASDIVVVVPVNVRKCCRFLSTLIELSKVRSQSTVGEVKDLVQKLVDNVVSVETFLDALQIALHSSPQPYLVPFLKRSLPGLRQHLLMGNLEIEHICPPLLLTREDPPQYETPKDKRHVYSRIFEDDHK